MRAELWHNITDKIICSKITTLKVKKKTADNTTRLNNDSKNKYTSTPCTV